MTGELAAFAITALLDLAIGAVGGLVAALVVRAHVRRQILDEMIGEALRRRAEAAIGDDDELKRWFRGRLAAAQRIKAASGQGRRYPRQRGADA